MCAFSLSENVNPLILQRGILERISITTTGIPKIGSGPSQKKPDLIFFDPPYYSKKEKEYEKKAAAETPSISSYRKEEYERFLEGFFLLAHQNAKPTTRMAFLNADWIDFESTPAMNVDPDKCITSFDYHHLLTDTGWKVCYRIDCPFSSERLNALQVQRMQEKRILGTVSRYLLIAKRS